MPSNEKDKGDHRQHSVRSYAASNAGVSIRSGGFPNFASFNITLLTVVVHGKSVRDELTQMRSKIDLVAQYVHATNAQIRILGFIWKNGIRQPNK